VEKFFGLEIGLTLFIKTNLAVTSVIKFNLPGNAKLSEAKLIKAIHLNWLKSLTRI
jgi:hypothetical protein